MVRIAYIINSVEGGGAASPVPEVARVMREWGAEVRLFALTRRDGRALSAIEKSGLSCRVRPGGEKDHLAALLWLDREVRAFGATHLWTSLTRATLLGQLVGVRRGIPVASWQHAAFLKPANRRLLRFMRGRSRVWVGDSQSVTELTAARLAIPRERLMCWPIFSADPAAPVATPWAPGQTLRIGSLGRLHPVKGYDVLVAALARLKTGGYSAPAPIEVLIAGDGAERDAILHAAATAGLGSLVLTGFVERPREFLASLHLYVQPSRSEGFCIALHEALQAGLPAIASAVGEIPWTLSARDFGITVPPGDPQALADALAELLAAPERLAAMGAAARRHVLERFSRQSFEAAGQAILRRFCA
jgi:glycosyltransferase involved in cell wall biosynthesis